MLKLFTTLSPLPADPIYGLQESFKQDSRTTKLNLSIGVLTSENGSLKRFESVEEAYKNTLPPSFSYAPISGNAATSQLILQEFFPAENLIDFAACQSLGGTGALSLLINLACRTGVITQVAYALPTWPNHLNIIKAQGLLPKSIVSLESDQLNQLEPNTLLILQPCCHNPTGVFIPPNHWEEIFQVLQKRQVVPLFDLAYWGLGTSLEDDLYPVRLATALKLDFFLAFSVSKPFGLYNCRTGWAITHTPSHSPQTVKCHLEAYARATYSSPPALGSALIHTILSKPALKKKWKEELRSIRNHINGCRMSFGQKLHELGYSNEIHAGRGLFTQLPLSRAAVEEIREQHALYIGVDGRINLAALAPVKIDKVAQILAEALHKDL